LALVVVMAGVVMMSFKPGVAQEGGYRPTVMGIVAGGMFGLSAIGSILVDPDEQPSARRISDLRRKVGQLSAVCAFAEPGQQPKIVASVTEGTPTRRAILDPEGIMLEPGPDLYFKLMRGLANTMKTCLAALA
jgi:zinc transport system substrate-binding protein